MMTVEFKIDGNTFGMMNPQPKEFKTGSRGMFCTGKVENGKKYQVTVTMVEIGSNPAETAKKK